MALLETLLAAALFAAPPSSSKPEGHVQLSLVASSTQVAPGSTFTLGVHFEMDEHWHIYWNGVNDSGQPPKISLELPQGWAASEFRWPAPTRLVTDIVLDHVYEGSVTLLATITVPKEATGTQNIQARGNWMVCKDVCLMERGSAELTVTCDSAPGPASAGAAQIAAAEKRIPKVLALPASGEPSIKAITDASGAAGARYGFSVAGADRLEFYPLDGCAPLKDAINEASVQGDRILLTLTEQPADPQGQPLKGVLAVWSGKNPHPAYYQLQ